MTSRAEIAKMDFPEHLKSGMEVTEDGYVFPLIVKPRFLSGIKKVELRPTDIFVLTWPKSGTTWMQYLVSYIVNGREFAEERSLGETHIYLEMFERRSKQKPAPGQYETMGEKPSPRFIKSHLAMPLLPTQLFENKQKIIYVARNPKDAAVSYFHFCSTLSTLPAYKSWDEFYSYFCKGLIPYGNYFDHVLPWWEKRNQPNVLFIKYEDMKKDPKRAIVLLSEFLEKKLTDAEVDVISDNTSFSKMKKNNNANMDYKVIPGLIREGQSTTPAMRKGQVGDWKNYFTVSQNEEFDKIYESKMAGTGLTFDFI